MTATAQRLYQKTCWFPGLTSFPAVQKLGHQVAAPFVTLIISALRGSRGKRWLSSAIQYGLSIQMGSGVISS